MTIQHDEAALREIIRQGERILQVQLETRESALRRAGELLRLAVATLGGMVVVAGLFATSDIRVDLAALIVFGLGVGSSALAVLVLAAVIAGRASFGIFVPGPDLQRLADRVKEGPLPSTALYTTLVHGQPNWIRENERLIAYIQKAKAGALVALASGNALILGTILYIVGGTIS